MSRIKKFIGRHIPVFHCSPCLLLSALATHSGGLLPRAPLQGQDAGQSLHGAAVLAGGA